MRVGLILQDGTHVAVYRPQLTSQLQQPGQSNAPNVLNYVGRIVPSISGRLESRVTSVRA